MTVVPTETRGLRAVPLYVLEALGAWMRVSDDVLKTVVFVGTAASGTFTPVGTGFLLGIPGTGDLAFTFVVTAAHLFDLIAGDHIWVRYNTHDGGAQTLKRAKTDAWFSEKRADDFAAVFFGLDPAQFDQQIIKYDRRHWEEVYENLDGPNLGQEVITVGLYGSHYGQLKNVPVVRVGNVSMLPGEPVMTNSGYVRAYLVETKSISGLSGSPVFLNPPSIEFRGGKILNRGSNKPAPIGMMLGYHVVETAQDQISVPQIQGEPQPDATSVDERNTGFAVVLPLMRIFEYFESEWAQAQMKKAEEAHFKNAGYRPAGIKTSAKEAQAEPEDANPDHKEDFTSLLNAAATKKPQAS